MPKIKLHVHLANITYIGVLRGGNGGSCHPPRITKEGKKKGEKDERKTEKRGENSQKC